MSEPTTHTAAELRAMLDDYDKQLNEMDHTAARIIGEVIGTPGKPTYDQWMKLLYEIAEEIDSADNAVTYHVDLLAAMIGRRDARVLLRLDLAAAGRGDVTQIELCAGCTTIVAGTGYVNLFAFTEDGTLLQGAAARDELIRRGTETLGEHPLDALSVDADSLPHLHNGPCGSCGTMTGPAWPAHHFHTTN